MQILYGNDQINYCVIAKSADVTENILNELKNRGLFFYNFSKEKYNSIDTEPISFSYIISSLNGNFLTEMMIIIQSKRMGNRKTPSYYTHVEITPLPEKMTDMAFYKVLNRKFINDINVMEYKKKDIDTFNFEVDERNLGEYIFDKDGYLIETSEDALTKKQIQVILRFLYHGLQYLNNPVVIVLDKGGDEYNKRAREVIFTIYKYIPHILREKISFCTYYSLGISKIYGIHLVIVEKTTDYRNYKNVVDLNKEVYDEIGEEKSGIEKNITYMIQRKRKQSLILHDMFLYENMEIEDSIRLFNDIEVCVGIKNQELDNRVLEQSADYFYIRFNKNGRLVDDLKKTLQKKLKEYKERNHSDLYQEQLKSVLYNEEENKWFSVKLIKYIRLGETLEIEISFIFFKKWLEEKIVNPIYIKNKNNKKMILLEIGKLQQKIIKCKDLGGTQFHHICLELYKYMDNKKKEIETTIV